jgi:hypothetical protein
MTTSPIVSKPWAITTFRASLSTTSWPGRSSSSSMLGLTLTRILRPPVNTSALPSGPADRNTPKPLGGCARRSTSSFRATIWSRASRSVPVSRSFCPVIVARFASASRSRSSMSRDWRGESASLPRRAATSSSRKEIFVVRTLTSSSYRPERALSSREAMPLTPSRELTYLDPTYQGSFRNLAAPLTLPLSVTIRERPRHVTAAAPDPRPSVRPGHQRPPGPWRAGAAGAGPEPRRRAAVR